MMLSLKKQSAVPMSSFDEPPGKQVRRNPAALSNNILWIISKKQDTQCKFQSVLVKKAFKDCPKKQRNIKNIQIYVNDIRELRNRVCHYEKIIQACYSIQIFCSQTNSSPGANSFIPILLSHI